MALLALVSCRQAVNPDYNPSDASTFGLAGDVKEVKSLLEYGADGDEWMDEMAFDEKGRITLASYAFNFEYDENGQLISDEGYELKRDDQGRIASYGNPSDDEDYFSASFEYDDSGRTVKEKYSGWEWYADNTNVYKGNNLYPSEHNSVMGEGGEIEKDTVKYKYIKFDSRGNWIERKKTTTSIIYMADGETQTETSESIEKRITSYWSEN